MTGVMVQQHWSAPPRQLVPHTLPSGASATEYLRTSVLMLVPFSIEKSFQTFFSANSFSEPQPFPISKETQTP